MELIITEKRNMAKVFSEALSDKVISKKYSLTSSSRSYIFSSGHIIQVEQKIKTRDLSSVERILDNLISKKVKDEGFKKELEELIKRTTKIIIATDYDTEGEVIGRDILKLSKRINLPVTRWKFSSLVKSELLRSYKAQENLENTDSLYYRGEARRELDFIEGISATKIINLRKIIPKEEVGSSFYTVGRVKVGIMRILNERNALVQQYLNNKYTLKKLRLITSSGIVLETTINDTYKIPPSPTYNYKLKERKEIIKSPLPYNTKRLIQKLAERYSPSIIKEGLEKLYYHGLITYPRTDTELFDKDTYIKIVNNKKISSELLISPEEFHKISIQDKIVDHPAISPTFINSDCPVEYSKFYKDLEKILLEPFLKTLEKIKPYLEVEMEGILFSTENTSNFKKIEKEDKKLQIIEKRIYKKNYTLPQLLEVMSKYKIGTKSTQLSVICELESKKIFKREELIEPNSKVIEQILRRVDKASKDESLFNKEYCLKIQEKIDNINNEKELKKLKKIIIDKWKRIVLEIKKL